EVVDVSAYGTIRYEASGMVSPATPILPGETEITVTVYVVFYIS
ncbi:hypothetical protein KEJ48_04635, partial [Candidatus Bathyarchaeota archaeon]|nr:hypothetical protein [Candidatus Bathyarchaeota archaeon]